MPYHPIQDYGIVGDMHTVALISTEGSVDWFCAPAFDSPSVFGALLDDEKGGRFEIHAACSEASTKQFYWPDTNVLVTRFLTSDGVGELLDFMPIDPRLETAPSRQLVRGVRVSRGTMRFRVRCTPAFDYARARHDTMVTPGGACFRCGDLQLVLQSSVPLAREGDGATAEFVLREGERAVFALHCGPAKDLVEVPPLDEHDAEHLFRETVRYWRQWLSRCTYQGRWREVVHRSALVLKLLTYQPTGAIVAAPTCSLPERIGGTRNWDYRYTWIRDAAFTLYALLRIGFTEEARGFMSWLDARCHELEDDGSLQIVYGIDGRHVLDEVMLDHLDGYRGSKPVRIGNDAYKQLQLDIYGELMDSVYLYNKYGSPIAYDTWGHLRRLTNWVCNNWEHRDEGIWEVRGGRQHFVYSKLMCWVAVDRALRLADKRSFPADRARWYLVRDQIYEQIMDKGFSAKRDAFVQSYGSDTLDASNLIMPLVFFVSPSDPRMLSTLKAIHRTPAEGGLVSDSLVYRYDTDAFLDGVVGREGTFNMCTFWLVEALTRAARDEPRKLDQARLMFERMLGYANHLGLYSEETGPSGEALGNFPQAFTHIALISAAFNLDRTLSAKR